jgi:hypothetical protein
MADDNIWFDTKYEPSRTNKIVKNFNCHNTFRNRMIQAKEVKIVTQKRVKIFTFYKICVRYRF